MATRLLGSPDLYGHQHREAEQSVNFVTSHDGFTLNDLVSYNEKHNEANAEHNRDGTNDNFSWNCGIEGPTADPEIEALRTRQIKNFLVLNLFAAGLPMIAMGDEMRRTQCGNNNAYCHDDEISWLDWTLLERHADVHRFAAHLVPCRARRLAEGVPLTLNEVLDNSMIEWHGVRLAHPDWGHHSHSLAVSLQSLRADLLLHGMANMYSEPLTFELPPTPDGPWRRWIDTALQTPEDITEWTSAPVVPVQKYTAEPHSVVVLFRHTG